MMGTVTGGTGTTGTWTPTRTSDDYTPAVLLMPDGTARRVSVQRVRLDTAEAALEALSSGRQRGRRRMSGASWTPTRTSNDYTPAVQLEAGKPPKPCSVQHIRCMSVEAARAVVAAGGIAWVKREEWERVKDGESND